MSFENKTKMDQTDSSMFALMSVFLNATATAPAVVAPSTRSLAFSSSPPTLSCLPVTTVENFDVEQYASAPWYVQQQAENAYIPLDQNRCVTAQYSLRHDDELNWWERSWWGYTVDVFNYAETSASSDSSSSSSSFDSTGGSLCADYDEDTQSQLRVAPCFLPQVFAGPYWVVAYNETGGDGGYALVSGGPPTIIAEGESDCGASGTEHCCKTGEGINRSGLWLLTRQKNPSEALVEKIRGIARQKGFSTSVLFDVIHDENCKVPGIDTDESDGESSDETGNITRFLRLQVENASTEHGRFHKG